jgi:hypothetical protein
MVGRPDAGQERDQLAIGRLGGEPEPAVDLDAGRRIGAISKAGDDPDGGRNLLVAQIEALGAVDRVPARVEDGKDIDRHARRGGQVEVVIAIQARAAIGSNAWRQGRLERRDAGVGLGQLGAEDILREDGSAGQGHRACHRCAQAGQHAETCDGGFQRGREGHASHNADPGADGDDDRCRNGHVLDDGPDRLAHQGRQPRFTVSSSGRANTRPCDWRIAHRSPVKMAPAS